MLNHTLHQKEIFGAVGYTRSYPTTLKTFFKKDGGSRR